MSSNLDKVEAIDDMAECCDIMKSFVLPTKGINTLDQMKTALSKHLKDLEGTSTRKVGEVSTQPPIFLLGDKYIYRLVSRYHFIVVVFKCCVVRRCFSASRQINKHVLDHPHL